MVDMNPVLLIGADIYELPAGGVKVLGHIIDINNIVSRQLLEFAPPENIADRIIRDVVPEIIDMVTGKRVKALIPDSDIRLFFIQHPLRFLNLLGNGFHLLDHTGGAILEGE